MTELVIKLYVFCVCDYFIRNIHPLKNFNESLVYFTRECKGLTEILLASIYTLTSYYSFPISYFLELEELLRRLIQLQSSLQIYLLSFLLFNELNNINNTISKRLISEIRFFSRSVSTLFLMRYFSSSYFLFTSYFLS